MAFFAAFGGSAKMLRPLPKPQPEQPRAAPWEYPFRDHRTVAELWGITKPALVNVPQGRG